MASTADILDAAKKLGELINQHETAKKLEAVADKLKDDTDAQRALTDYNRHLQTLAEKEANQKPIEVEDKRKLEQLQKAVVTHPLLRGFQVAQMDYVDLLRKVDEAMTGDRAVEAGRPA